MRRDSAKPREKKAAVLLQREIDEKAPRLNSVASPFPSVVQIDRKCLEPRSIATSLQQSPSVEINGKLIDHEVYS